MKKHDVSLPTNKPLLYRQEGLWRMVPWGSDYHKRLAREAVEYANQLTTEAALTKAKP